MLASVAWLLLCAAAPPSKLAAPGFNVAGVEPAVAEGMQERFIERLTRGGDLRVTSARDIQQLLGLERQKQLLGCAGDQPSCLAELAGALGVDGVLTGSLVKAEGTWIATVRIIATQDGATVFSASTRARSLDATQDWLEEQADEIINRVHPRPPSRPLPWIAVAASAVVAGTGALLLGLAYNDAGTLRDVSRPLSGVDAMRIAGEGRAFEASGYALLAVGGAGLVASVLWLALQSPQPPVVSVGVAPGAVGVRWSVTW